MEILDGKKLSLDIQNELKEKTAEIKQKYNKVPTLVAILIGENPASQSYVKSKIKACHRIGYNSIMHTATTDITESELLEVIKKFNNDDDVDGILVQLPLPSHIDKNKIIMAIDPKKDVDGFHPVNLGKMLEGLPTLLPATPKGILSLIKRYNIETKGKKCVVVGRSNIVGSPISVLMSRNDYPGNATVTLTHRHTENLKETCKDADIIIVAVGKVNLITEDMVKDGAVIIDVGINRVEGKLRGDVDFENVKNKCSYITPVPGGVGPMTIASLLENTMLAFLSRNKI